jgi:hypothetical protein
VISQPLPGFSLGILFAPDVHFLTARIELMKHMLTMIDNDSTEDAGQVVKNPTSSYVCEDLARQEWD